MQKLETCVNAGNEGLKWEQNWAIIPRQIEIFPPITSTKEEAICDKNRLFCRIYPEYFINRYFLQKQT